MTYRNDVGGLDLEEEPKLWTRGERQPYGGHVWHEPPQEAQREARTMRALDCLMSFALGAACSLSAVLIALDIASR